MKDGITEKRVVEKDPSRVKVKVTGTGFINRADGTKEPFVFTANTTEERAKRIGAVKESEDGSNT